MLVSSVLHRCLLVAILIEFVSGRYIVDDFPVNITCLSHIPFSSGAQSFRCVWLPPFNDSLRDCSISFRATDEYIWGPCTSLAGWNQCNNVLQDGPVCKIPWNACSFEIITIMLDCGNGITNSTSLDFYMDQIVIPKPPTRLRLIATFKGRMNLSWEWPSGWHLDDLHGLQLNVKYWQEVGGKQIGMNTIRIPQELAPDILPWDLSGLEYSYVNACVQMSSIYKSNGHSSVWSEVACNRTQMERPDGKPEKITVRQFNHDEERGTRDVNVSWTPIPEIQKGGPNLYYEVKIILSERLAVYNVSEADCFYVFEKLNATDVYNIQVTACNVVGRSAIHETYVLDRLGNPTDGSTTFRYGMIIGVIIFVAVIILVVISSLLVLKKKLNRGNNIEWSLNVPVPQKVDGNVFEAEKEVFDQLWEKKESNNNGSIQSIDGIEEKPFHKKEEYQPFIPVKNGWTTKSQCSNHQPVSTGYVDAGGKVTSGGKVVCNFMSEYVSDGKKAADTKSEYVPDDKIAADVKSEYVSDGKIASDFKSEYVPDGKIPVDIRSEYVPDNKTATDTKSEYVPNGKIPVDIRSEYVPDNKVATDVKSEYVSDGKAPVDIKSEHVPVDKVTTGIKSEYVPNGKIPVDKRSEYVPDNKVTTDVRSEYVSDGKTPVDIKSEHVPVDKVTTDIKCDYVPDGKIPIDIRSEYVPDRKVATDIKSENVPDGKVPANMKPEYIPNGLKMSDDMKSEYVSNHEIAGHRKYFDVNGSCRHAARGFEQSYIQL